MRRHQRREQSFFTRHLPLHLETLPTDASRPAFSDVLLAVRDARSALPLELAVRHDASAAVVQALKQAHVSISALLKTGASDAEVVEAVQGHGEAAREVGCSAGRLSEDVSDC